MDAQAVIALVASGLAAIIAVVVPQVTFRLALRQDHIRWMRERRADTYIDMLTEAYAEQRYFEYTTADDEVRARMREYFVDLRLKPLERARLGARGTIFSSRNVNVVFNHMQGVMARESLLGGRDEGERLMTRVRLGEAHEKLEDVIRRELGADEISLAGQEGTFRTAFREGTQGPRDGGGAKGTD